MEATGAGGTRGRLLALLAPVVEATGHDLEDVVVTPAGRRRQVRVVVDRDGGVDLDAVADVSHAVSDALDAADEEPGGGPLGGAAYVLEVTSPGVDRPLTEDRHWRRAAGRLVKVVLRDGRTVTARVVGAADGQVTLEGQDAPLALADVARASVQVEFSRVAEAPLEDTGDADTTTDTDADADDDDGTDEEEAG